MQNAARERIAHGSDCCVDGDGVVAMLPDRVERAKVAFSCRRAPVSHMATLITGNVRPRSGDLVLARVERIGQHKNLETPHGRCHLFIGDEIIVCYGNRYAPDQFEAEVPASLARCDLVASGGMASEQLSRHEAMSRPTSLQPVGLVGDVLGRPLNLARWALDPIVLPARMPIVIAVVGTTMNAGKTTTAANLIRGLVLAGNDVAAVKVTGTASPNDIRFFRDAGASPVLDFTDAGHASTYRAGSDQIEAALATLLSHVAHRSVVVLEIADGLFQRETNSLLRSALFRHVVNGVLFAAGDAMGAKAGTEWLLAHGLPVLAVSGVLTRSPLACREAAAATGLPILTTAMIVAGAAALVAGTRPPCGRHD